MHVGDRLWIHLFNGNIRGEGPRTVTAIGARTGRTSGGGRFLLGIACAELPGVEEILGGGQP